MFPASLSAKAHQHKQLELSPLVKLFGPLKYSFVCFAKTSLTVANDRMSPNSLSISAEISPVKAPCPPSEHFGSDRECRRLTLIAG